MKITHYHTHQLCAEDFKKYCGFVHVAYACKFYSQGKNGKFELRILISRFKHSRHMNSFNLGFGVWDDEFQDLDDIVEPGMAICRSFWQQWGT